MNLFILKSNQDHLSVIMLPYNVQTVVTSSTADQMDESQNNVRKHLDILSNPVPLFVVLFLQACEERREEEEETGRQHFIHLL